MFESLFVAKRLRQWKKALRRTAAKLGEARDHDVQIEFLCGILSSLTAKEYFAGIARILVELERERERLQPQVVDAVERMETKGTLQQLRRATKALLREAGSVGDNLQTPAAQLKTRKHILRGLDGLLQHAESLADADDQQSHHAMRIAAKRLRYTVEIARPVYPGRLDESLECLKKVQSLLGEVHDCDVWAARLDTFSVRQCRRSNKFFGHAGRLAHLQPGIDYLRRDRRRHREGAFARLVQYWAELEHRRLWDTLRAIVSDQPSAAIAAGAPPPGNQHHALPNVSNGHTALTPTPLQPSDYPPDNVLGEEDHASPKADLTVGS